MRDAEARLAVHNRSQRALPHWVPGSFGLVSGAIALASVVAGSTSWMILGVALVIWILAGWAIYFGSRPLPPAMAALGSLLLVSAAAAALAVLSGLYLLVLGPSWIL